MKETLIVSTAQIIITIIITLLGLIGTWLGAKLGESTKLENTRAAVNTVIKMAQLTAQELQQTLVEDLKARAVDGKLSETNILVIRKKLQAQTREKLSAPVCELITTAGIDLGALISGAAEAWINKQKNYAWGENGGN